MLPRASSPVYRANGSSSFRTRASPEQSRRRTPKQSWKSSSFTKKGEPKATMSGIRWAQSNLPPRRSVAVRRSSGMVTSVAPVQPLHHPRSPSFLLLSLTGPRLLLLHSKRHRHRRPHQAQASSIALPLPASRSRRRPRAASAGVTPPRARGTHHNPRTINKLTTARQSHLTISTLRLHPL